MQNKVVVLSLTVVTVTALVTGLAAQATGPELRIVSRAADALGGRGRIMAVKTRQIIGNGELAYFNGGGNIAADPAAPQKWQKVLEHTRTIDLEHWRTRVQQRLKMDFVFASTIGQLGLNRTNETLDGEAACDIGGGFLAAPQTGTPQPRPAGPAAARQRRVELLAHPITIVRAALDPSTKLSNFRKRDNLRLVDITVRQGDTLTLAMNATSSLPAWVSYDGVIIHVPAPNLLVEADLTTQDWDVNWWGDSLMNNIEYRRIKVDTNLSVHAQKPFALPEVVSAIERQVRNTQAFCRRASEAQFFQPGCPIQYNRPLPPASDWAAASTGSAS